MKKLLLSFMTMLYIAMSSGIAMDIHYCMGKQTGTDLYGTGTTGACGKCGMKKKNKACCSDQLKFIKLADAHKHVAPTEVATANFILLPLPLEGISQSFFSRNSFITARLFTPPPLSTPLFVRNCVFRI